MAGVPGADEKTARAVSTPPMLSSMNERPTLAARVRSDATRAILELSPEVVVLGFAPGWFRSTDDVGIELPAAPYLELIERDVRERANSFWFKARALEKAERWRLMRASSRTNF